MVITSGAAFSTQQSGEKALKACLYEKGYTSDVTHSLKELSRECSRLDALFEALSGEARTLDMFYIPTRSSERARRGSRPGLVLRKGGRRQVHKLRRIDVERSKEPFEELRAFAARLKKELPVREVYLYGSFARGEIHEGSDIDLIVVGDFTERLFERIGKILDLTDLPVEPLAYTREEFEELRNSGSPFILKALKAAVRPA